MGDPAVIWGTETTPPPRPVAPGIDAATMAALEHAISVGALRGFAALLGQYDDLLVALWVANGPARQTPTLSTNPLPVISSTQLPQRAAAANPLRRAATIQNPGSFTIVVGKSSSVGQPGSPDVGIQIAAGQSLILSGAEWTEDIFWGTISSAASPSQGLIHEEIVPEPPWPRPS